MRLVGVFALFFLIQRISLAQSCIDPDLDRILETKRGLYIGELHGSNEMPDYFLCLVDYFVQINKKQKIVVSLELPESAREPSAVFWRNQDGRASQRMYALVQTLLERERRDILILHFQYKDIEVLEQGKQGRTPDQRIYDALNMVQEKGFVLALGGNIHNMKTLPVAMTSSVVTAGMMLGDTWVSVRLAATNPGEVWACSPNRPCGLISILPSKMANFNLGRLNRDQNQHHDFIWFLPSLTPSRPVYEVITH